MSNALKFAHIPWPSLLCFHSDAVIIHFRCKSSPFFFFLLSHSNRSLDLTHQILKVQLKAITEPRGGRAIAKAFFSLCP